MANVPSEQIRKAVSVFGRSVYSCKSEVHIQAMDFEQAFKVVDAAIVAKTKRHLKDIEVAILRGSWQGKKYQEIAEIYGYTPEYLKQDVGPKLWKLLSEALGEKLSKTNFQAALERHWRFSCTLANADAKLALPTLPLRPRITHSQLDTVVQPQKPILCHSEPKVQEIINKNQRPLPLVEPELPVGQVPLDSSFYVERPPIESRCYQEILQPGALIRIKAASQMGKTSLMARILYQAREHGYQTLPLSFQLADRAVFTNLDTFLRWFCESVGRRLKRLNQLDDYWTMYGSKDKTSAYFEECLLEQITSPLVVGLEQVERVFSHCDIADEFFSLLRTWYEYAKYGDRVSEIWKKLRVVMVYSIEDYIPLDINQSPFNVGLNVELHEFSPEQVQDLVGRHPGLNWTTTQVQKLMNMVGGHPYLVRLALYHIQHQDITLEQLLQTAPEEAGIYSDHLRRHLWNLKQHPELAAAFNHVLTAAAPVELDLELAFRLYSMGLVMHRHENYVTVRCDLYRQYFRNRVLLILRQLTRRIGTVEPELQERIRQLLIA